MFKTLINIFRIPELRSKVLFTLFMLMIYRIGYHVPIPGVDQTQMQEQAKKQQQGGDTSAASRVANYISIFSGGNLSQSTIFGLGIMPYISASIIFQLLTTVMPQLEKLQKEGETGRKKIQEWTRYATVPLCIVQAIMWLGYMQGEGLVLPEYRREHWLSFWTMGIFALTAGCVFLMWLGEQIDEYGLGNGVSLIILAGIVARMPTALVIMYDGSYFLQNFVYLIGHTLHLPVRPPTIQPGSADDMMTPGKLIMLVGSFIFIVAGSILITQAQRRIPIQQAKHTRGRKVYGGSKQYLPLRVNHGGVMPIIFAQSLMLFPGMALGWLDGVINARAQPATTFGN